MVAIHGLKVRNGDCSNTLVRFVAILVETELRSDPAPMLKVDQSLTLQPAQTTMFTLSESPPQPVEPSDRREGERHMTLYRVGSMIVEGRRELCLIKNISAGGMMVRLYCDLADKSAVTIELKSGQPITGQVCWTRDNLAGVSFDEPIDVVDLLSSASQGPRPRMPRVAVENFATLRQGAHVFHVTACDISQGGAKLRCGDALDIDGDAVLSLPGLDPRQGVVRWQSGGHVGVNFNSLLPLSDLVRWLQDQRGDTQD